MSKTGLIYNIQRFSVHDGPGIRTTVFMKGCALKCPWCSNPESIYSHPEIMVYDIRCIGCWRCVESCPIGAITRTNNGREINRKECDLCLKCVDVCPSGALEIAGKYMSVDETLEEIEKDRQFYLNSGGGVTFSGGEPLFQAEFVVEVLSLCKRKGMHTTLDTTGHAPWPVLRNALAHTDLVLYDIKHLDPVKHKAATRQSNKLILNNLFRTIERVTTWLRIPIIPNFNDSEFYFRELSEFIANIPKGKLEKVSILPYHNWGEQKYLKLGKKYAISGTSASTDEHIQKLKGILESTGITVSVGS